MVMSDVENPQENRKAYYTKLLSFGDDFKPVYALFRKIIKKDKYIIASLPENRKALIMKCGLESAAVKFLIKQYVKANEVAFLKANRSV